MDSVHGWAPGWTVEGDWVLLLSPVWAKRSGDYPRTVSVFLAFGWDADVPFTKLPALCVLSSEGPKRFGSELWLSWFGLCAGVRMDVRRPGDATHG